MKKIFYYLAVAATVLAGSVLASKPAVAQNPPENANAATVKPVSIIPFMSKAPTIDGKLDEGEWNTLHVAKFVSQQGDLLQPRLGEFWVGSDGKKLYIAVKSAYNPDGILATVKPAADGKDTDGIIWDDGVELWINNNPGAETGQYYQIMVNSLGALFDSESDLTDKIAKTYYRVGLEQAHKVEAGIWTAEIAIDLASIKVTDPTQQLALRVCRNYKYGWDQAHWAPLVRSFDSPETMPLVRFVKAAPVVSELGFQDKDGVDIAVSVSNPTDKPLPIKVKLGYNPESQPRYYKDFNLELKPGETKECDYRGLFFSSENYPAIGEILVSGTDGTVFYHRDFKWHTKPQGPLWDAMGPVSADEAVKFDIEFHPTPMILRTRASFANLKDKESVKSVRVAVVNQKTGATFTEQVVTNVDPTATEQRITLKNLPDGRYEAQFYLGKDAKPVKTAVFDYIASFPWKGNKIGVSDRVIPPFTPLTVKDETVGAVLREHKMTDTGLWAQVNSLDRDILASPMTIEITGSGKTEVAKGKLSFGAKKPNAVIARSSWQAAGVKGKTTSEYDYDGSMKVSLEFGDAKTQIDSMRLVIPIGEKYAPLLHTCADGTRFNYAGAMPAGEGIVWSSDKSSRNQILGTFIPYIWIGGEERGLCWFASSDKDWVLDFTEKVPDLAIERRNGVVSLVANLVQKPVKLDRTHKIVFGLQATPTRPMPESPNWRTWGCVSAGKFDTSVLGMCSYWGGELYSVFPREKDFTVVKKIAEARTTGKIDTAFFDDYVKKYPDVTGEVRWSMNGRSDYTIPYTNLRGEVTYTPDWLVYQNEWHRESFPARSTNLGVFGSVDFTTVPTASRRDYLMYYYREFLRNGFAGIYWDNTYMVADTNPVSGTGYYREDGSFQPSVDIWEMRELFKRMAVLSYEMGKPNVGMPHMTDAHLVPVFTWSAQNLDWEWKYGGTDFQDRFKREFIRACTLGRQSGSVPIVLQGITEVNDPKVQKWVERTRIAACVPHEIKVWQTDPLFASLTQKMFEVGYGEPSCKVYNYWDEKPVLGAEGMDLSWIVLDGPKQVMVFVCDYGNGGSARVKLDTKQLSIPADFKAVNWENAADTYSAASGVVKLVDFKKHDFRVLLINK